MPDMFDLILVHGTVVNHDGIAERDIGVKDGRITAIGRIEGSAPEIVDCTGLHVLPGVIDTQVHFREPGLEHKEDLESGSRAAILGGVTAVFEMPNTDPPTTSSVTLIDKITRASGRMLCDFAFYVGGTRDNAVSIPHLESLPGSAGIKVFIGSSTGTLLVEDDRGLREIIGRTRRRAAFHAEDELRLRERAGLRREGDASTHPVWRDEQAALTATRRLLGIAREIGKRVHVLHVSTAEEMDLLRHHRDLASVEVTPHHLTLAAPEAYERLGSFAQMNPPVRDERHRRALWRALAGGLVDVLGSDHAPHAREEKERSYPGSPSGMTGVQTLVPIMLDHVNHSRLTLLRLVDLTSAGPARLFGIAGKGRIAAGYDADFTVVDMRRQMTIRNAWIASKCGWTPYDGVSVTGWPVGTVLRGKRVMWDGEVLSPGQGQPIRFHETLAARPS
jgi:dihydroorotase